MARLILPILALLLPATLAKTDHDGCTSFTSTVTPWPGERTTFETVIYYVPDTLEICEGVDCGGGRAPPKNVPGCPMYKGTELPAVKYLPTNPVAPVAVSTTVVAAATSTASGDEGSSVSETSVEVVTSAGVSATTGATVTNGPGITTVMTTTSASIITTTSAPAVTTTPVKNGTTGGGEGTTKLTTTSLPAAAVPTAMAALGLNILVGAVAAVLV